MKVQFVQFLEEFLAKVKLVDLTTIPVVDEKLKKGDKGLGVLPDDLKRLYAVYRAINAEQGKSCMEFYSSARMMDAMISRVITGKAKPEEMAFIKDHELEHKRTEFLSEIFWTAVREWVQQEHPETDVSSIGIREDWQIVIPEPEESDHMVKIIRGDVTGMGGLASLFAFLDRTNRGFPRNPGA